MKNTSERFENAYNKIVRAYNTNRLKRKNCSSCLVGNILLNQHYWYYALRVFRKYGKENYDNSNFSSIRSKGKKQIESSGYSIEEIDIIERKFERTRDIKQALINSIMFMCEVDSINEQETIKRLEKDLRNDVSY